MKVDLGFWNEQGEYIEDIQEINEMDMDKYFEELNDMANFKNFGEKPETEEIIGGVDVAGCEYYKNGICQWSLRIQPPCEVVKNCYYKQLKRLEQENAELKAENERLKAEIKRYKNA